MKVQKTKVPLLIIFSSLLVLCSINFSFSQDKNSALAYFKNINKDIYVFDYEGANLTILSGNDGLLIVDAGEMDKIKYNYSLIKNEFRTNVKYVINTHYHYDVVGGNKKFSDNGAIIIAHENTRKRMMEKWVPPKIQSAYFPEIVEPYSPDFLPDICFANSMELFLNNEIINLKYLPGGHSNTDIIVHFEKSNIIHVGDLYMPTGFPPFEGPIEEYLSQIDEIIELSNDSTIIVPGHGSISGKSELIKFRDVLSIGAKRIIALKQEGKTIDEVIKIAPLEGLLPFKSEIPESVFIFCVFQVHDK
jgi:cyclase